MVFYCILWTTAYFGVLTAGSCYIALYKNSAILSSLSFFFIVFTMDDMKYNRMPMAGKMSIF